MLLGRGNFWRRWFTGRAFGFEGAWGSDTIFLWRFLPFCVSGACGVDTCDFVFSVADEVCCVVTGIGRRVLGLVVGGQGEWHPDSVYSFTGDCTSCV